MNTKKLTAVLTAVVMMAGLSATGVYAEEKSEYAGTEITLLNSKGEIQEALENMADEFENETGISVEVLSCATGESPYTKITSAYNSGSAPTMSLIDPTDVNSLAEEYGTDLSDEKWISECEDNVLKLNDKVYGFPFCIEGKGIIYNKKAIEDTLGKEFDPSTINSYDSLKQLLEDLKAGGMETPVVLSKEDWLLGNHILGMMYDTYDGTTAGSAELIDQLKDGSMDLENYERYTEVLDTLDLLAEYNINGDDPLGAMYDQDPIYLADGDAALWVNGCWAWPNLEEAGADAGDEYGFLPYILGNDTSDFANNGIQAAATKYIMIDKEQASDDQIGAAKEFLNWLVYSDEGQKMLVEDAAVIPACGNNKTELADPLSKDVKQKMSDGKVISSAFVAPADHWSILGADMQKYFAGEIDRAELAKEIKAYWAEQK